MTKKLFTFFIFLLPLTILGSTFSNDSLLSSNWVDSTVSAMTLEEKIAQLFMVAAYSNKNQNHIDHITDLVESHKIGGLMFMQGGPHRQLNLTNLYQSKSKIPLIIAQDAEWGLSMRIDSTLRFPWQMTLGAVKDTNLIYEMGLEIAKQCRRLGVHINFAPVVDVNSNPKNPIINNRSFGEDPYNVAKLSNAYMQGLQDGNVIACAKHFPGHGDTDADSHKSLPTVLHKRSRLDSIDLVPFNALIKNKVGAIMVAHLHVPDLDAKDSIASSLSYKIINDLLKDELGFEGLVVTDALNMKGVSNYYSPGELDLKALMAGNDILLFSEDVPLAIHSILTAVKDGLISEQEIEDRCKKILSAKYKLGLHSFKPIPSQNLIEDLNNNNAKLIIDKLFESSITLLQNEKNLIPIKRLDTLKIAAVCIGENSDPYQKMIKRYAKIDVYELSENHSEQQRKELLLKLSDYNLVLASVHKSDKNPWKSYRINQDTDLFLQTLGIQSKVVLSVFANPYSLSDLLITYAFDGLVIAYQNSEINQRKVAQAIFGGLNFKGRIPVSNKHFNFGDGIITNNKTRISYNHYNNYDNKLLKRVDSIVNFSINEKAFPGCQIIAMHKGDVFYKKSFGYQTYKKANKVEEKEVYDIASITKIAASVISLMKLTDKGKFNYNEYLTNYVSLSDTSNKRELILKDILAHQSGLKPWIPFYKETIKEDGNLRDTLYSTIKSDTFSIQVAEGLYLHYEYPDSLIKRIIDSDLLDNTTYKYSDLGYYFIKDIVESLSQTDIQDFINTSFYNRLGTSTITYLPKKSIDTSLIVPTEFDYYFRSQLLRGDVHDMGAAMLGGIGGHAGLFSNANDLAILFQMLMQNGEYGGEKYLEPATILDFTKCHFCNDENRRGLGFDKPVLEDQDGGPACDCNPSKNAFGHSGFTGTLVWADPDYDFVYVFLSNRIHPTSENKKILDLNIRTEIMNVFYDYIRQEVSLK
jgi:beta-glucosidase-like glycosyl hydrolase/CubicO group peptidase (beta-lactamase class C family)